ncbi:energy transducer TonB family protein [Dyella acidiphila]|uniref:Energy transducer TonB n=1 Tax=Dyella acidiphila TaxID=2775866 RepID=A0ABR9GG30_9GAMM|nr:energy transducer TonB [Dyella acidiphila]MBE1162981.1 energy transducer TonB [Dyella acidiphila]
MLRLRTTTGLSVLALVIGVIATQWLSDLTGSSAEPRGVHRAALHRAVAQHVAHRAHAIAKPMLAAVRVHYAPVAANRAVHPAAVAWVPVSMPMSSLPFAQMRDHDAGDLVLHLVVDAGGQVTQATLAQSSGDAVLDANAVAIAHNWRFAVPADHPLGFSGDLPLSFGTTSAQLAQMR